MALVRLPFQPRWRPLVLSGEKTTTVRTRRHAEPGDEFELDGARFAIVAVEALTLADARDRLWRDEGMASPAEFEATWRENHPTRGFRGADTVWAHRFRRRDGGLAPGERDGVARTAGDGAPDASRAVR